MNVFFDVQGTLISSSLPRPLARETLEELTREGHAVYLWSSGGVDYASRAAKALGVEDLVSGCHSKSGVPPASVDFAVDDHPSPVQTFGGYLIPPFDGDPEDRELLAVVEAVRKTTTQE